MQIFVETPAVVTTTTRGDNQSSSSSLALQQQQQQLQSSSTTILHGLSAHHDTVDSIRRKLLSRFDTKTPESWYLVFRGRPLLSGCGGDKTLAECGITDESLIQMRMGLCGGMMIKVKTLTGKEIEIDIEPSDTVERIKERVEEKEGIPPVQQRWVYDLYYYCILFIIVHRMDHADGVG